MFSRLKFIFNFLGNDYYIAKRFLEKEFKEYFMPRKTIKVAASKPKSTSSFSGSEEFKFDQNIVSEVQNMKQEDLLLTFWELRRKIRGHQEIFHACHSSVPSSSPNRWANAKINSEQEISRLKKKCIYIIYWLAELSNFERVDLHGLYLEEAEELMLTLFEYIEHRMRVDGRSRHQINVITGRGLGSSNGPVLAPKIKKFLDSMKYSYKPAYDGGSMLVTIIMK